MYGYGPANSQFTNNPFVTDPTHASSRFPDLSASASFTETNSQYQQWPNNNSVSNGYTGYVPQFQQQQQYPQQQLGGGGGYGSPTSMTPQYAPTSPGQFQPSSSFGQQLSAAISGSSYSYLNGQPTGLPQQQLGPAQQQIQNNPGYAAQFDPYGPLSQWDGTSSQQPQQQQQQQFQQPQYQQQQQQQQQPSYQNGGYMTGGVAPTGGTGVSPTGDPHPKHYVMTHKKELDGWDSYTWKQLLNSFEALKTAWEGRKGAILKQAEALKVQLNFGGYYQQQQQVQAEVLRLQSLYKDAASNFDSVTASTFQMQEVFHGYRQSRDPSSKSRVREATNAALKTLPDWPPASI